MAISSSRQRIALRSSWWWTRPGDNHISTATSAARDSQLNRPLLEIPLGRKLRIAHRAVVPIVLHDVALVALRAPPKDEDAGEAFWSANWNSVQSGDHLVPTRRFWAESSRLIAHLDDNQLIVVEDDGQLAGREDRSALRARDVL